MYKRRLLVLVSMLVLLCTSCGSNDNAIINQDSLLNGMRSTYGQYTDSVLVNNTYKNEINYQLQHNELARDAVQEIMSDSVITADEMNDLERQTVGCFAKYGYKVNVDYWFAKGGGVSAMKIKTMPPNTPKMNSIEDECESANGYSIIVYAYYKALYNPDDIDLNPYRFQCYQEHDLVDKDMSYDEFNRQRNENKNPFIGNPQSYGSSVHDVWFSCTSDPLHNISNSPLKK
ncbi:hypothetical protein [Bifidobacterium vespertilionis]|uniref:Lipoprotein n=1 Tax=Bifidobacterium vespertilionis TaxID=2562524 RepID=A0A5J5DYJ2_9BIFI|nr:hypothetical protein [Bifidobacterium vespertilionis]KAA8821944.1 hypothetical protein EMO90_01670 [Bifidobacterium vespertilionis]KAA8823265.1 hypothetical protein EM848_06120 [Bifidobacterium vespertilionis]